MCELEILKMGEMLRYWRTLIFTMYCICRWICMWACCLFPNIWRWLQVMTCGNIQNFHLYIPSRFKISYYLWKKKKKLLCSHIWHMH